MNRPLRTRWKIGSTCAGGGGSESRGAIAPWCSFNSSRISRSTHDGEEGVRVRRSPPGRSLRVTYGARDGRFMGPKYRPADHALLATLSSLLPRDAGELLSSCRQPCSAGTEKRDDESRASQQRPPGRPTMSAELVELIVHLGRENRRWGCVRVQGEPRKLGIRIAATSVRRVLRRHSLGPAPRRGPSWTDFLRSKRRASWQQASSVLTRSSSSGCTCCSPSSTPPDGRVEPGGVVTHYPSGDAGFGLSPGGEAVAVDQFPF